MYLMKKNYISTLFLDVMYKKKNAFEHNGDIIYYIYKYVLDNIYMIYIIIFIYIDI